MNRMDAIDRIDLKNMKDNIEDLKRKVSKIIEANALFKWASSMPSTELYEKSQEPNCKYMQVLFAGEFYKTVELRCRAPIPAWLGFQHLRILQTPERCNSRDCQAYRPKGEPA